MNQLHPQAASTVAAAARGQTPAVPTAKRRVTLALVDEAQAESCGFWLGLARGGPLTTAQLLDAATVAERLEMAATVGMDADDAVLLADAGSGTGARILLLLPPPPPGDEPARGAWLREATLAVARATGGSGPPTLGLYIPSDPLPTDDSLNLILAFIQQALVTLATAEYVLFGPQVANHVLLNGALKLRGAVEHSNLELYVLH